MDAHTTLSLALVLVQLVACQSARILGVFPIPSISHQVVYRALTLELARRGHQLTVITPDPVFDHGLPPENYTQIDVHDISYTLWNQMFNWADIRKSVDTPVHTFPMVKSGLIKIFDAEMSTPGVKELLNSSLEFDLLLLESLTPMNFAFAWRFKAPYIGVSSLSGLVTNYEAVGNPTHPILYSDIFREKLDNHNLWERIKTVYIYIYQQYVCYSFRSAENFIVKKYFGEDTPSVDLLENNMDMLFVNEHPLLAIRPNVPAVVQMGGMHLKPKKKLPEDLQAFLDSSPQGVVYMSLGSNVRSKDLPSTTISMILEVFRHLPYRVLWKFESDLPGTPDNVRTEKWLPQQDLLGHPNIKAFITQGGQQSMEEAIRDGVPLIGIPFLGDQELNVQRFQILGIGVGLNINTLTKEDFREAIMKVTKDPRFKANVRRVSRLVSDQPESGLERAVWWAEYVIRHGGAAHLRAPAATTTLLEYLMLDVIAAVVAVATAVLASVIYTIRLIYKLVFQKRKVKIN